MVSSQSFGLVESNVRKYHKYQLNLTIPSPDSASTEHAEFDFSDVFGSPPALSSAEAKLASPIVAILGPEDPNEKVFEDPEIIHRRSHSLVGPSAHIGQLLDLKSLAIHESDSSTECIPEDAAGEADELEKCDGGENSHESGNPKGVGLDDFDIMKLVGQGAFGKVYQVNMKGTSEIYAMKVMRKDKIMENNHVEYMKAERDILTKVDHPFVVQLRYSFQTKYRLYLVFDFINGGHLFFQLYRQVLFSEDLARVYTAEIVSAVSHLHENGIMHRDLKPENILVDADGHVVLTDFGLAKQFDENTRSNSMCGTVEYMAPEIILGKGHNKAADWWSVGILLFEMLTGKPPFMGGNRNKIQQKVIKEKIKLPNYLTAEAHSLLKGLLQKESNRRLGSGPDGANEIKKHKWFKSINWKKLEGKEVMPSFVPSVAGKQCIANFEEKWTKMPLLDSPVSSPVGDDPFNFPGFTYVRPSRFRP